MILLAPVFVFAYFVYTDSIRVPGLNTPLHASCKITWTLHATSCTLVQKSIEAQINAWKSQATCKNGGQKCLYALKERATNLIRATHTTPVKRYVDSLTFELENTPTGCTVKVIR